MYILNKSWVHRSGDRKMSSEQKASSDSSMDENEGEHTEKNNGEVYAKQKIPEEKKEEKLGDETFTNEEELLGSVTTVKNPGLRTSARVIQKMKQDSIRPTTPPPSEKKDPIKEEKSLQRTPSQSKAPKVIWTNYEKNLFFDALNEFGKDFESIANFINSKIKKKNAADHQSFKTKEQIRQIYYQTFHKLSKYLKFSEEVKKPAQELYALINYGEMRRKLAFVSEKNCMKMKDLVYKGHVTVRSKGKNIRIKTPPCKSLRRLNQLQDWQEDINLPSKVEVCLRPANMEAWGRVQSLSQNPLVRTAVPLQKKLINLIKTFQYKWRSEETKMVHQSLAIAKQNASNAQKTENKCTALEGSSYLEPLICVCPPTDVTIHKPLVSITEFLSSFSICLNSYEQKIGVKIRGETLCNKRQRTDSGCDKRSPDTKKPRTDLEPKPVDNSSDVPLEIEEKELREIFSEVSNSNDLPEEFQEILSDDNLCKLDLQDTSDTECGKNSDFMLINCSDNATCPFTVPKEDQIYEHVSKLSSSVEQKGRKKDKRKDNKREMTNLKPLLDEQTEKQMRKGWTELNAGDVSVGDLYITFGQDSKIMLEYHWIKRENENDKVPKKEKSVVPYSSTNINEEYLNSIKTSNLCNKLKHLLLIASLTEKIKKKQCNCGHVCEKGVKTKKPENDLSKSYVSNKTYASSHNDYGVFRQPAAPYRRTILPIEQFRLRYNQSRLFKSRYLPTKQVVVQRLLPVQPGINQSYDVVTPQVHVRTYKTNGDTKNETSDVPKNGKSDFDESDSELNTESSDESYTKSNGNGVVSNSDTIESSPGDSIENTYMDIKSDIPLPFANTSVENSDNRTDTKDIDLEDDPGIKQLMEISLPSPAALNVLDDNETFSNIPPMSPMRLIRETSTDSKWLEENFSDFSLSSFLGHLDEINRDGSADSSNISVISETSIDYVTKFAEIAASMQNEDKDL